MSDKLLELLKFESRRFLEDFNESSRWGQGTPQEISEFRENALRSFLIRFLPSSYRVVKGKITDVAGNISSSIDCVILNPIHPYTVDSQGKFTLIFADGVDSVIEVKPDITDFTYLVKGLEQIRTVKYLRRLQAESPKEFSIRKHNMISEDEKAFYRSIPCFIFSVKFPSDLDVLTSNIKRYYRENNVPIIEQLDYLLLHNVGIISNIKFENTDATCRFKHDAALQKTGFFLESWKEDTLAALLLKLSTVQPCIPRMFNDILTFYFSKRPEIARHNDDNTEKGV
jgi:hypothetical protein